MTSKMLTAPWARNLARGLALWFGALAIAPSGYAQPAPSNAPSTAAPSADRVELLILPLVKDESVKVPETLTPDVVAAASETMRTTLDGSGRVAATVFEPSSPIVRRAIRDQGITEADVAALSTSPVPDATITKVATELGFNKGVVVSGDLAAYSFDATAGKVDLSLSLTIQNRGAEAAPKSVAVGGSSKPVAGATEERPLAVEAAQDAGRKAAEAILQQIGSGASVTTPQPVVTGGKPLPPPATKLVRKSRVWTGALAVLGAIALTLVLTSGGGNHNNTGFTPGTGGGSTGGNNGGGVPGGGETPPPPPF